MEYSPQPRAVHWSKQLPFEFRPPLTFQRVFDREQTKEQMQQAVRSFRSRDWEGLKSALSFTCMRQKQNVDPEYISRTVDTIEKYLETGGGIWDESGKPDIKKAFERCGLGEDDAVLLVHHTLTVDGIYDMTIGPIALVPSYFVCAPELEYYKYLVSHGLWSVRQKYYGHGDTLYSGVACCLLNTGAVEAFFEELYPHHRSTYLGDEFEALPEQKKQAIDRAVRGQASDLDRLCTEIERKKGRREAEEILLTCADFDEAIALCLERF